MEKKMRAREKPKDWLNAINRLTTSFNLASRDMNQVMNALKRQLQQELGASAVSLWVIEEPLKFMKIEAASGLSEGYLRYFNQTDRIHVGKGLVGRAIVEKKTVYASDIHASKYFDVDRWRDIMIAEGLSAVVCAPMYLSNKVVGSFSVYFPNPTEFIKKHIQFIEIIANSMAITLENIKQYQEIEGYTHTLVERVEKLSELQKVTDTLSVDTDSPVEESLDSFFLYLNKQFSACGLSVFWYDKEADVLRLRSSSGLSSRQTEYLQKHPFHSGEGSLIGLAFRDRTALTSSKVFVDERIYKEGRIILSSEHQTALAVFPLALHGRSLGAIAVHYLQEHFFSEEEKSVLTMLAHYIGISFLNTDTLMLLNVERERMKSMVGSIHDGLIAYDDDGRILAFNVRAEEFFGVKADRVVGKKLSELSEDESDLASVKTASTLQLNDYETGESVISGPVFRVLNVTQVPLLDEKQERSGLMRIIHDRTIAWENERQQHTFAAIVSHQLRSPLTTIIWALDMVLKGEYGEVASQLSEQVKRAFKSAERLNKIVNGILDISRVEEWRLKHKRNPVDVSTIVTRVYNEFRGNAKHVKHRDVEIILQDLPKKKSVVMGNKQALFMVIENVVENALRYTEHGKVEISLKVINSQAIIEVKDTGIGVPHDEQRLLFTKFFRASNAVKMQPNGTGLGLYIGREIVTQMSGRISFNALENGGSSVRIELPLAEHSALSSAK